MDRIATINFLVNDILIFWYLTLLVISVDYQYYLRLAFCEFMPNDKIYLMRSQLDMNKNILAMLNLLLFFASFFGFFLIPFCYDHYLFFELTIVQNYKKIIFVFWFAHKDYSISFVLTYYNYIFISTKFVELLLIFVRYVNITIIFHIFSSSSLFLNNFFLLVCVICHSAFLVKHWNI